MKCTKCGCEVDETLIRCNTCQGTGKDDNELDGRCIFCNDGEYYRYECGCDELEDDE